MFKPVAIVTLTLGLTCLAQPPQRGGGDRLDHLKTYLSLTDAQVQIIQQARQTQRDAMRANSTDARAKQQALRDQLKAGASADPATLGRLMIEAQANRAKMQAARKAAADQLMATLTPDQKAKLQVLQDAAKRQPEVREAIGLGLIDPPAGAGPDGGSGMMFGGPGGRGPAQAFRGGGSRF